ncbi:UDP-N-acetylmuramoyl-tripeptide--D-alanyl-D-alanine ligase [Roseomonas sp. NAR14]|uniref:UDP-N-acetylmuramoyl-tripeptide--D-alanyl-D-alanine ligase n=1 Tax=Roseomonas acroporae TaxID=2937791 RepID=A0A9X1Y2T2_9PROT|nr:UDP-N-acetylmuramoyl-tripeptide--D-alanyl-D-alanine ligase [Roseomonas acroporae]MCK8783109.1 UDP-N-acetylmuramoyl-tripeptide--D-alanyl-D-alanine ligase [Roseomonas acroporae]
MSALWTAPELRAATGGTLPDGPVVTGIAIDSRALQPGDLFVALRDARDGHEFVAAALAAGAAAALVDRDPPGVATDAPLLRVADTLEGLRALARAARARSTARVIGVTGSVGKTSTKEMLRHALGALAPTHASAASHNNHWGVPLTLARLPREAEYAIVEMGMNHAGEIGPLSRLARPDVVVITTVAPAHIGLLGSIEAIADAKAEILEGLAPGGTAVLPADSPLYPRLVAAAEAAGARVVGFGAAEGAVARLLDYAGTAEGGEAEVALHGRRLRFAIAAPGRHMALNALAALAAAEAAGADPARVAAALAGFGAGAGRGQRVTLPLPGGGTALLLDDSYNASTASVRAGLAVLAAQPAKRRLVALGDMRELGEHGPALHAALAPDVAAQADLAFCCGELMRHLHDALPEGRRGAWAADSAALAPRLAAAIRPGDAVLVKGSLGSRMAVVLRALKALAAGDAAVDAPLAAGEAA